MATLQGRRMRSFAPALVLAGIALAAGAAIPATSEAPRRTVGTNRADVLTGTRHADRINGRGGADRIAGLAGADVLIGGSGYDRIAGGRGHDVIRARDGGFDVIDCGPGRDTAYVDRAEDGVYDCERLVAPTSGQRGASGR